MPAGRSAARAGFDIRRRPDDQQHSRGARRGYPRVRRSARPRARIGGRRDREIPRGARRTATRPSCGKRAARTLWKQKRGPEERVARAVRPRQGPGRGEGRLRRAAALLRRRRPRHGPRNAPRALHGHAAGLDARRTPSAIPSAAGSERSDFEALVAYVTAESQGVTMNVTLDHPKEHEAYRDRREDLLLPRRPARLRLRHLPRRERQAHPAAGPAQPHREGRRAARLHDLARVPRVAGRAAHLPVAAVRLLPPAALPRARVRAPRPRSRSPRSSPTTPTARLRRPGDQALSRRRHEDPHQACDRRRLAATLAACAACAGPSDAEARAKATADDEGVVQGARPGEARPPRPGRDADAVQRCRQGARRRTSRRRSRRRISRRSGIRPTASYLGDWKRGERIAQTRHRQAVLRRSDGAGRRATATPATSSPRPEISYGTIGPSLYNFGKLRGYETRRAALRLRQDLQLRRPSPRAPTCRASATTAS